MNIENIDFCNERSEDCVLIDTKAWERNTSQTLNTYKLSGRDVITYITRAISINPQKEILKGLINKGDLLLLTRVASEVAPYRAFAIEGEDNRYYNVPILQVIGKFENDIISLSSLKMFYNRVLVEKVTPTYDTFILSTTDNTFVGKVIKTSSYKFNKKWEKVPLKVKVDDIVLIRDNIDTEIKIGNKYYYVVEESMIAGIFHSKPYLISEMEVINDSILMLEYTPKRALNSILLTPDLIYEDLDYTEIYNRNLFQVKGVDSQLTNINKDDILLVLRDLTNYIYFNMEKYFIISGTQFVEAKIIE